MAPPRASALRSLICAIHAGISLHSIPHAFKATAPIEFQSMPFLRQARNETREVASIAKPIDGVPGKMDWLSP